MKTAIAILNYNGSKLLQRFLPSVIKHRGDAQIIVIDNASSDDSVIVLKKQFPDIKLIIHKLNYGYAEGYNKVIPTINADFICLLNNDVEVTDNWITPIVNHFIQHPTTAFVQPKILDVNRRDYFEYAGASGGFIDAMGLPYCRGRAFNYCEKDTGQYNDSVAVTWASGSAFWIRKDVFISLGGFDISYFMHFEEIDLCLRAQSNKYKVYVVPNSTVYHLGAGTLKQTDPKKLMFNIRNFYITYLKNLPLYVWIWWIPIRLLFDFFVGIHFLVKGQFLHIGYLVLGHWGFFGRFITTLSKRSTFICPFKLKFIIFKL